MPPLRDRRVTLAAVILFVSIGGPAIRNAVGWWIWGAIVIATVGIAITWLLRAPGEYRWSAIPYSLRMWVGLAALSLIWSHTRLETLLGLALTLMGIAVALPLGMLLRRNQLVDALAMALRWLLALSLMFELIVAWFIRHPIGPVWLGKGADELEKLEMWSRNLLFVDGKIQGVFGNSTMLATAAAVGLIVFAVQWWRDREVRVWHGAWALFALLLVGMTRSVGVLVSLAFAVAVIALALVARRCVTRRSKAWLAVTVIAAVGVIVTVLLFFSSQVLALFGKDATLTNRTGIWAEVIGLAEQHPVLGWGWVGYWPAWAEPFDGLVVINGVEQLHAHNAWLDVWMQLGSVGVAVFVLMVARTLMRAWFAAISRPQLDARHRGRFDAVSMLPLAVLALLVVQTASESHLLVEGWWVVFVVLMTKLRAQEFTDPRRR